MLYCDWSIQTASQRFQTLISEFLPTTLKIDKILSERQSRVGLVQFSTKTVVEFGLNEFTTKESLFRGLDGAKERFKNMGYNSYAGLKMGLGLFRFRRPKSTDQNQVRATP